MTKFKRADSNMETITKIIVAPNDQVEIRSLEIKNDGNSEEILEITSFFEPILSTPNQDYAHPAFNNLFIIFEELENNKILVKRRKRDAKEKELYMCVSLYTENEGFSSLEYEIDKEKFRGLGNIDVPDSIIDSKPYSNNMNKVTDPILALKRTLKIKPNEKVLLNLIISVSESAMEAEELVSKFENSNIISKTFELVKAKGEAEIGYLGLLGNDARKYQKMLSYLLFENPIKKLQVTNIPKQTYSQSSLWKYGISRRPSYSICKN